MSKQKEIRPAMLTLAQAAHVQTILRKFETHFQIKSVKHKPLGREVLHDGDKYTLITRKVSHVEDRHIYRSDIYVGNSKDGTIASLSIVVVRRDDEQVEDVIREITFNSLLAISSQMFLYQQLGDLARRTPGYYVSGRSIVSASSKSTMSLELQEPTLHVGSGGAELAIFELYRQSKEIKETVRHRVVQNSAVWSTLKQFMMREPVNPNLNPDTPMLLSREMLTFALADLANKPLADIAIDDEAQYQVVSGSVKAPGLIQPLDYEMHVFVTIVNKKQSAIFRLSGVNSRFTVSVVMQLEPVDGLSVITNGVYQEALKIMGTAGFIPSMEPVKVTDEQRITFQAAYQGRAGAPTINDYAPYEVNGQPFLLSHPSFTIFDARLEREPVFTSFLTTPHKETLSLAAILTSDKVEEAKKPMERIAAAMAKHTSQPKTPVQTMAERMAAETRERMAAEGVLHDAQTGQPIEPDELRPVGHTAPIMNEVAAGTAPAMAVADSDSFTEQTRRAVGEEIPAVLTHAHSQLSSASLASSIREVTSTITEDWAIPFLVGTKWPRSLRMDITMLKSSQGMVYLALLAPQYETFEKSIGYLAEDYQSAGVDALLEAKKRDVTLPFSVALSAGEAISMLEKTFQLELRTARSTGDAHALEMSAQATVERIVETYETIVGQFNQATRDGQAAVAK